MVRSIQADFCGSNRTSCGTTIGQAKSLCDSWMILMCCLIKSIPATESLTALGKWNTTHEVCWIYQWFIYQQVPGNLQNSSGCRVMTHSTNQVKWPTQSDENGRSGSVLVMFSANSANRATGLATKVLFFTEKCCSFQALGLPWTKQLAFTNHFNMFQSHAILTGFR